MTYQKKPHRHLFPAKVMVPISASELYNGVEKKVFVFPRFPASVGKEILLQINNRA